MKSAVQGEVLNLVGWRPITDDAKTALGVLSGDEKDLEKIVTESTFLHRVVQQKLISAPTMIGGPL